MTKTNTALNNPLKIGVSLFSKTFFIIFIFGLIILSAFWIGIPLLAFKILGKPTNPGELGDTFGVVNSLFSALAFVGLLLTIKLQFGQIAQSQIELQESSKALREQVAINSITARLAILPELIREQRNLLANLDGVLSGRLLTESEVAKEIINRTPSDTRPTIDPARDAEVCKALDQMLFLLQEQHRLFNHLRTLETPITI